MESMGNVNILDNTYHSHLSIPSVIEMFSAQCITAADQDIKYCPLASKSLNTTNPATDLAGRIYTIFEKLKTQSFWKEKYQYAISLQCALSATRNRLMNPREYPGLASLYRYFEQELEDQAAKSSLAGKSKSYTTPSPSTTNITTADYRPEDPLIGDANEFVNPAVLCLDNNLRGIENASAFVDHMLYQIDQDLIAGGLGLSVAVCLGWPDLEAYGVERPSTPFPETLRNKVLVVGITGDPVTPYHSALNTYNFIGAQNANFLRHEGIGHCTMSSWNTCTEKSLTAYFVNGEISQCYEAELGAIPDNGTTCTTSYEGKENIFVKYYKAERVTAIAEEFNCNQHYQKRLLGLGLGLGALVLINTVVIFYLIRRRRKVIEVERIDIKSPEKV